MKKAERKKLLQKLTIKLKARQLDDCGKMLEDAGVPEFVEFADGGGCNSVPDRLRWYLLRRKFISKTEQEMPADHWDKLNRPRSNGGLKFPGYEYP